METHTDTKNKNRVAGICQQIIFKISRLLYNSIHSQVSATYHFLAMLRLFPTSRWLTYRHWLTLQDFLVSNLLFLVTFLNCSFFSPPQSDVPSLLIYIISEVFSLVKTFSKNRWIFFTLSCYVKFFHI